MRREDELLKADLGEKVLDGIMPLRKREVCEQVRVLRGQGNYFAPQQPADQERTFGMCCQQP